MDNRWRRRERIEVAGVVQGVGFRPFVHNLARANHLDGFVLNNTDGVVIEVEGDPAGLDRFVSELVDNAPPLCRIIETSRHVLDWKASSADGRPETNARFEIRDSEREGRPLTLISPDTCTCEDCLAELFDPDNRRYLYPFINCTNCGPRFTITKDLPYDRLLTTMADFTMCERCLAEYEDPADRRFHAQPNACPECGPHLRLLDAQGTPMTGDPLSVTISLLQNGRIVAVKGLGGFHLAVDATDDAAVRRLRRRKLRDEKPFAVMVGGLEWARRLVQLTPKAESILSGPARPILLARRRGGTGIADTIAPDNTYLGLMLPYTPLHYLLFFHPAAVGDYTRSLPVFRALVMTSGNISDEPICKDNDEAIERLSGVADAFLVHDRDIHVRSDDSVVNLAGGEVSMLRRSRGYAPLPVFLREPLPCVLALGGELKNTLCLTDGRRAFLSQHVGDLENIATLRFFREVAEHFTRILGLTPTVFAHDMHPEYLSTKYLMEIRDGSDDKNYSVVGVQHHHAHITSVTAEHGCDRPVIGFSLDGTGYGLDRAIWGGEVLIARQESFSRFAHLVYVPMPGGSAAIREPWRMAFAYLREAFRSQWPSLDLPCLHQVSPDKLEFLSGACDARFNSPFTSSLGRLFDAIASILDIQHRVKFEGQAALMLEMLAAGGEKARPMPFSIREGEAEIFTTYPPLSGDLHRSNIPQAPAVPVTFILDYTPTVRAIVEGIRFHRSRERMAASFHETLLASFMEIARLAREVTGINTVALSGGCWQNRILTGQFPDLLRGEGFDVLCHHSVPPNDGGLSLGQAFTAARITLAAKRRITVCASASR